MNQNKEQKILSKNSKFLIASHYLFKFGDVLSELFINIFLFKYSGSITIFLLFNAIVFGLWGVTEFATGSFLKNKSRIVLFRASFLFFLVGYLLTLVFKYDTVHYFWLIAIFIGLGRGFQYGPYELLKFDLTSPKNRSVYERTTWMVLYTVAFIAPLISGYVIIHTAGGYFNIFALTCVLFAISFILSFFIIKNHVIKDYAGKYQPFVFLKKALKIPDLRNLYISQFTGSIAGETIGYFLGIVMLAFALDEFTLSTVKAVASVASIIGGFIFGYVLQKHYQRNIMLSAIIGVALSLLFFAGFNYWVFIIFSVVGSLASSVATPGGSVITMDLINKHKLIDYRIEMRSVGALFTGVTGRFVGYFLIFFLAKNMHDPIQVRNVFIIFSLIGLVPAYFFTRIKMNFDKLRDYKCD